MAYRLFSAKPLSEPMLPYRQSHHKEHRSVKFYLKSKIFIQGNALAKMSFAKWRPFLSLPQCVNHLISSLGQLRIIMTFGPSIFYVHHLCNGIYITWDQGPNKAIPETQLKIHITSILNSVPFEIWLVDVISVSHLILPFLLHLFWGFHTLKRKCRHFDEILITGCTGSCHFDNFKCSQWWKFHQNEDISVSVYLIRWWTLPRARIQGLRPTNERRHYKVTPSLIGWAQA